MFDLNWTPLSETITSGVPKQWNKSSPRYFNIASAVQFLTGFMKGNFVKWSRSTRTPTWPGFERGYGPK